MLFRKIPGKGMGAVMSEPQATPAGIESRAPVSGAGDAVDELLPALYEEMHSIADAILQQRRPVESTRTTSLIHDAYVRLAGRGLRFNDRSHFLCLAATVMRRVLIDRARRACTAKRGRGRVPRNLVEVAAPIVDGETLLALDDALSRLAAFDERKGRIVELRFFGGLSLDEAADATGLSVATVKREWTVARAWLSRELERTDSSH